MLLVRLCTIMCLQAQAVIVGWQVYSITRDPFMLGLTGLAEALPAISCALFSGHVVDISRPHRVYVICIGVLVLNTLALFVSAGGMVSLPKAIVLRCIFLGIFVSGIARSFVMPSNFALLPQIVPRAQIPLAMVWLNSFFQFAAVCGPAIAGLIYGGYGARAAWLLPVMLISISFISLLNISHIPRHYRSNQTREPALQSIIAGWRFILHNPVLLAVMLLDMFAVLFGGAVAMLPAYADRVLHIGSEGLGILRAAPAFGAMITALALALRQPKQMQASLLLWVVTGFGICMIGFGLSTVFWLSVIFLLLSGAFDSVSVILRSTLAHLLTPETMRGRVSAVSSMFIISSNELGAFESGVAAKLLGLVPSVVFGGVMTLLIVISTGLFLPALRHMPVIVVEKNNKNKGH